MNYYNEFDPKAAAWLRELIANGLIPPGDVDERSITEIKPHELTRYVQCHFFAGIGGWPLALQLAGWPAIRPVWSGSAPCQPFSSAGKGLGTADERHLWPVFAELIRACKPPTVFGEQVASKAGRGWLAGVFADLEGMGYQRAGADLCAAGVGAPHIRQRLYWCGRRLGDTNGAQADAAITGQSLSGEGLLPSGSGRLADSEPSGGSVAGGCESGGMGHTNDEGSQGRVGQELRERPAEQAAGSGGASGGVGDAASARRRGAERRAEGETRDEARMRVSDSGRTENFWSSAVWHPCRDGKARRVPRVEPVFQRIPDGVSRGLDLGGAESGFPLCGKIPGRVALLKGYGNAIVPQVAAQFVSAFLEISGESPAVLTLAGDSEGCNRNVATRNSEK